MGQIFGRNFPILITFRQFSIFRLLPSASVGFRHHPSSSVSGGFWSLCPMTTCLHALAMTSGEHIWKSNMPWAAFAGEFADSKDAWWIPQFLSASVSIRHLRPAFVSGRFWPLRPLATCLHALATTSGTISGTPTCHGPNLRKSMPIRMMFMPFPIFRLLPSASASCRFGSILSLASVGDMSAFRGDDVGGSYLETQHAIGQICGKNIPILMLLRQFCIFRQLPPASVSFRHLPSDAVSGRFWSLRPLETFFHSLAMTAGDHILNPNMPWAKFAAEICRI